jgi:hypothetical protein
MRSNRTSPNWPTTMIQPVLASTRMADANLSPFQQEAEK